MILRASADAAIAQLAAEASLTARAEARQATFGRAWEQVARLMIAVRDGRDPHQVDVRVSWADAATRSVAQEADAVTKLFAAGLLPTSFALGKPGYTDDQYADMALGDISRQFVREWVADLSVDLAPASVHKTIGVLRQVLAMAVTENRLVINPVDGVELPPVSSVEQRFLTLDQLHILADTAGAHRPLVYVAGTTGLRFGELAELRWRDVDLDKRSSGSHDR